VLVPWRNLTTGRGERVAQLVYIDETGSVGNGARQQRHLTLVAVVVEETSVQELAVSMRTIAMTHLGWIPEGFEFHGNEVWNGKGHWAGKHPGDLLGVYEAVISLLEELKIHIVHASIDKVALHDSYGGRFDASAYRLALQFMLEKLDSWRPGNPLRILVADESKQERVKAIEMVADMQKWTLGEVPGRKLVSVIDSMHFVESCHSPGDQLADMVAFIIHRARLASQGHPDAKDSVEWCRAMIADWTPTYRQPWPAAQ
jgi:hypothetical protein